jgi:hypothetical protein
MISCSICSNHMEEVFTAKILNKYDAKFDFCKNCGYLKARDPYWLDEAYSNAIADADTGLVVRNLLTSRKLASILFWVMGERGQGIYADFAGGYGMLTRLMRDYGFNFFWQDKFCANKLAIGFEYSSRIGPCKAIVATEVLEHLEDPVSYLKNIFNESQAETLFFTTDIFTGKPPDPNSWYYYSFATGQHIGFFQKHTLNQLARNLNLNFYNFENIHIYSKSSLNNFRLRLATNKWIVRFSSWLIPRILGSKTMSDHYFLTKK